MCSVKYQVSLIVALLQICAIFCVREKQDNDAPVVTVKEGKLRGTTYNLVDGSTCYAFRGIPFAKPPVGDLRFKAPLPPTSWKGIRDATNFGDICTQYNSTYQGSEDCLFLNIYTKSLNPNAKIPVMVWIYGGSYYEGSGDFFLPDFLMLHNVMLVTFNYRLDMIGFLSLETPEAPGNAGLKDQVAALRWIQNNIAKFGGDPNSVTLFGESSGASSVTYHMFSPMSAGLFHKVIAQSGVCIHDWAIGRGAKARAFRAGKILGTETNDVQELLNYFKSLEASALTNLTIATLTPDERYRGLPEKFIPVIEKKFPNVEAFITENPVRMLIDGKVNRVPLMLGYNSGEGLIILPDHLTKLDVYNKEPSYYVPLEIAEQITKDQLRDFGDRIKGFYVGNRNITEDDSNTIVDMQTDMHFSYNTQRFAHMYTRLGAPAYLYRFDAVTDLNIIKIALGLTNLKGVSHADELWYLFYNYLNEKPYAEQEKLRDIVYRVTKLWTNFAKTGRPTPDNSLGAIWQPYTTKGKEYFKIDETFVPSHRADKRRIKFWGKLYEEAYLPYVS
ncbi:acetylcholinesterase-like [Maniola jurtina]|uniref:acetylcholinesterase-like n=1 Tax=Maniola jurtina TaxID=191418 RepID=UPI001E68CD61|nr:acetylcholinesterase-like [Maniola jurtina]